MAINIGGSVNFGPSDQTDLKGQRRCNLGCGGEPIMKGGWHMGPLGRPYMSSNCGLLRCVAFCSLLESS
jgi:hypothetical protein